MSTNVIKWSTQSNQRTVAFGSCYSVWVSLTLVCTKPMRYECGEVEWKTIFWVPVQLLSSSLACIDKRARQTDCKAKVRQILTFTSLIFDIDRFDLVFHCGVLLAPRVSVLLVSVVSLISWVTCIASTSWFEHAQAQVRCLWYLSLDPLHPSDQHNVRHLCLHQQVILTARVLYRPLLNTSLISHIGKKARTLRKTGKGLIKSRLSVTHVSYYPFPPHAPDRSELFWL